jgi:geranylgeranyl pyrophosphate synthase
MSLAVEVGARAAGATNEPQLQSLRNLIKELGVALQRFDDLGNLVPAFAGEKSYEDLRAGRLCWPWAFAAWSGKLTELRSFALQLPQDLALQNFLAETNFIASAATRARELWQIALSEFTQVQSQQSAATGFDIPYRDQMCRELQSLAQKVSCSYGFTSPPTDIAP